MATLLINPSLGDDFERLGLQTPKAFLRLQGIIYSGHPDRHVVHVTLGHAGSGFLKREHRVPWRERFRNSWQGFGPVSKSVREWQTLRQASAAGLGCPEAMAAGEDEGGQAFLLLRPVSGVDLRSRLGAAGSTDEGCELARRLGREIARLHDAGFGHGDLYSKHILVCGAGEDCSFVFLDWQRAVWRKDLGWPSRRRDLATLLATLADDIFSAGQRQEILRSYLDGCAPHSWHDLPALHRAEAQVNGFVGNLLSRRSVRELRRPPLPGGQQNLIWLDGEALCVTRQFLEQVQGQPPRELLEPVRTLAEGCARSTLLLPGGSSALLCRRVADEGRRRSLWFFGRRRPTSPELRQAGTIFRLERFGVRVPRLLAVGQRRCADGRQHSFLLTQPPEYDTSLVQYLTVTAGAPEARRQRRALARRLGEVVRAVHSAECVLGPAPELVIQSAQCEPEIAVAGVAGMRPARRLTHRARLEDLVRLRQHFAAVCSRTDCLRFLIHYCGEAARAAMVWRRVVRLTSSGKPKRILSSWRQP